MDGNKDSGAKHCSPDGPPRAVRLVATDPGSVWDVLADGWSYATWVVGTSRIRAVDREFPAVGAAIHHSVGLWPALVSDRTVVRECEPGRRLVLKARGGPLGSAGVVLTITPVGPTESRVAIAEDAISGPGRLVPRPIRSALIRRRNDESLRRLAYLAEGRITPPSGSDDDLEAQPDDLGSHPA